MTDDPTPAPDRANDADEIDDLPEPIDDDEEELLDPEPIDVDVMSSADPPRGTGTQEQVQPEEVISNSTDADPDSPGGKKVYKVGASKTLSLHDLLGFFAKHGSLRVSDLHLKVGSPPSYRVDGGIEPMKSPALDEPTVRKLILPILSERDRKRLEDDRAVDTSYVSGKMQYRINVFHDNEGLAAAVRSLESQPPPLESLGFPNGVWEDITNRQQGLVLITGITGAGKSTTIASLITHIAQKRACRIITLEDPIEYRLTSGRALVSQREVGRDVPSYERGLRDALREDPDVIFVGEMRDRDAATWTLTASETGHLVFSTLHTRDARGTLTRLLDMFPADREDEVASQLSLGLSHIISQKLIPRANGQGRVAAMEILNNSQATSNLIRTAKVEQIYSQLQTHTRDIPTERMRSLERSLAEMVVRGEVKAEEAERWANNPSAFWSDLRHLHGSGRR